MSRDGSVFWERRVRTTPVSPDGARRSRGRQIRSFPYGRARWEPGSVRKLRTPEPVRAPRGDSAGAGAAGSADGAADGAGTRKNAAEKVPGAAAAPVHRVRGPADAPAERTGTEHVGARERAGAVRGAAARDPTGPSARPGAGAGARSGGDGGVPGAGAGPRAVNHGARPPIRARAVGVRPVRMERGRKARPARARSPPALPPRGRQRLRAMPRTLPRARTRTRHLPRTRTLRRVLPRTGRSALVPAAVPRRPPAMPAPRRL